MLVLSRKINQKIRIGEDIELTIVSINGDLVRLGIDAPKEVKILRSEIYEELQQQNKEAATGVGLDEAYQQLRGVEEIFKK